MGNASITHSAIWLALVACYDAPPEVQLVVTRTNELQNVAYKVCDADRVTCKCPVKPALFDVEDMRLQRKLAIYVDAQPSITLALRTETENGAGIERCYLIELTDEMLVRPIDLSLPDPWCPDGGCEQGEMCGFDALRGEGC